MFPAIAEFRNGSDAPIRKHFEDLSYVDVPGLCGVARLEETKDHGWSLNPGRYVGIAEDGDDEFDFKARLGELTEELEELSIEALALEEAVVKAARLLTD